MTRVRTRWWLAALAFALTGACAGAGAGAAERNAELEARVARLERLLAPEAGPSDAAQVVVDDASVAYAAPAPSLLPPDANPTPADLLNECLARTEVICRDQAALERKRLHPEKRDGGFAWNHVESADLSPEGRACLKRERDNCERNPRWGTRPLALDAWLDAQLTPDRIDRAFSEKVRRRIDEIGGHTGSSEVECIREFCRVKDLLDAGQSYAVEAVHYADSEFVHHSESRYGRTFGYLYVTRDGYRFPE